MATVGGGHEKRSVVVFVGGSLWLAKGAPKKSAVSLPHFIRFVVQKKIAHFRRFSGV